MRNKIMQLLRQHPLWVIGTTIAIISGIIIPIVLDGNGLEPHFTLTVNPLTQMVQQGGVTNTSIIVEGKNGYEENVSLSASGQPSGVVVSFVPPIGEGEPTFTSNVNISVQPYVPEGTYEIEIRGLGGDGMERNIKYRLTVLPGEQIKTSDEEVESPGEAPKPPTAVVLADPTTIEEGESVTLTGVDSTDPDSTILTYAWNFGDDKTATGSTITHKYSTSGRYIVTLTVTDNDGLSNTATVEIIVNPPLIIEITSPEDGDGVPISTIVRGTISGKLPEGQHIWMVINPHPSPGEWWPQVRRIDPLRGRWHLEVWIGRGEEDIGNEFDIAVILVNEKDDQAFKDYIATGEETGDYPGIPLPPSANIMDVITVVRK